MSKVNNNNGFIVTVDPNKINQNIKLIMTIGPAYYLVVAEKDKFTSSGDKYTCKTNITSEAFGATNKYTKLKFFKKKSLL